MCGYKNNRLIEAQLHRIAYIFISTFFLDKWKTSVSQAKVFDIWSLITYRSGYLRSLLHPYTVQWSDFPIFKDSKTKELTNNNLDTTKTFLFHCKMAVPIGLFAPSVTQNTPWIKIAAVSGKRSIYKILENFRRFWS